MGGGKAFWKVKFNRIPFNKKQTVGGMFGKALRVFYPSRYSKFWSGLLTPLLTIPRVVCRNSPCICILVKNYKLIRHLNYTIMQHVYIFLFLLFLNPSSNYLSTTILELFDNYVFLFVLVI